MGLHILFLSVVSLSSSQYQNQSMRAEINQDNHFIINTVGEASLSVSYRQCESHKRVVNVKVSCFNYPNDTSSTTVTPRPFLLYDTVSLIQIIFTPLRVVFTRYSFLFFPCCSDRSHRWTKKLCGTFCSIVHTFNIIPRNILLEVFIADCYYSRLLHHFLIYTAQNKGTF